MLLSELQNKIKEYEEACSLAASAQQYARDVSYTNTPASTRAMQDAKRMVGELKSPPIFGKWNADQLLRMAMPTESTVEQVLERLSIDTPVQWNDSELAAVQAKRIKEKQAD